MKCWLFSLAALLILLGWAAGGQVFAAKKPRTPMTEGERLYRANCASCHRLISPSRFTDEQWPALVSRYGGRLKLPGERQALILDYLTTAN